MKKDILLEMFFDYERWRYAIAKGVAKDISKAELYQLTKTSVRQNMCAIMRNGDYQIAPPHTARIPKDDGTDRIVFANEPVDRIVLSIINDILFELTPDMIHKNSRAYQKGVGCGKIVKQLSSVLKNAKGDIIGWKADLSKYFDSVPIQYIDHAFDCVRNRFGDSVILDILRKYYHCDIFIDTDDNTVKSEYKSLKQGCAVASWLANVILYHIDEKLSSMKGHYDRYCDDIIYIGEDYMEAMQILQEELEKMGMKLNPKKVEYLSPNRWFKFLGFSLKGEKRSLSSTRIKTFQHEIEHRTIKSNSSLAKAKNDVIRYLYKGNGEHSWAEQILSVVNVREDINTLNSFVLDCLRAVNSGKKKIGGLGYVATNKDSCVVRGRGRNVSKNKEKMREIENFLSLGCMYNAMHYGKEVYNSLILSM